MKKLVAASVLALLVLASSQQQASAWRHCKFSIGLNFECASANNSFLWGAYRNGPTPDAGFAPFMQGPVADGYGPAWQAPAPVPAPPVRPGASPAGPQNAYAGYYYYAPYYYPQAGYYYNPYQYNPYQYAGYQANNPFNYYLMSYPGTGYSQGGLNFYGQ
jgi:hypothetical protein